MRFLPLLFLLAACSPAEPVAQQAASMVALYPDEPQRTELDRLTYLGGVHLQHPDPRLGGLSALHLSADGTRFLAVSDRARWITGRFDWQGHLLTGVHVERIASMRSRDGQILDGDASDSEAIAALGDGHFAVSFERQHRINVYALGEDWSALDTPARSLIAPLAAGSFENNGGMEGLTRLDDGRVLAGVETETGEGRQLWILDDAIWTEHLATAQPGFGLTALTAHGDDIYALERFWQRGIGNRIRILRYSLDEIEHASPATPDLLGQLDASTTVDNFEGLAVVERDGRTILVIVSDDNFSPRQRTLILAFEVTG